jgi:hypothetical protein
MFWLYDDLILTTRNLRLQSVKAMQMYLEEDLRINFDLVKELDKDIINKCIEVGEKNGINPVIKFFKTLI